MLVYLDSVIRVYAVEGAPTFQTNVELGNVEVGHSSSACLLTNMIFDSRDDEVAYTFGKGPQRMLSTVLAERSSGGANGLSPRPSKARLDETTESRSKRASREFRPGKIHNQHGNSLQYI